MEQDDFKVTASLAHLDLTEAEFSAALPEFERMLDYFAAMRAADTDEAAFGGSLLDLPPTSQIVGAGNCVRPDTLNANNQDNLANQLINNAPEREERFFAIPNVL